MTYTITKEFHFSAAHQLNDLPADHQCSRLHGHNYRVILELEAVTLDDTFFVRDYGDLRDFKDYLDSVFDHRYLNDVLPTTNPTAESLAKIFHDWCHDRWPETSAITVCETPSTTARYSPDRS